MSNVYRGCSFISGGGSGGSAGTCSGGGGVPARYTVGYTDPRMLYVRTADALYGKMAAPIAPDPTLAILAENRKGALLLVALVLTTLATLAAVAAVLI